MKANNTSRISILDSFRFIAILMVILYHYLYRFTDLPGLYPYESSFANFALVKYGYMGVQLFFIISGFVIFLTLEKSASIKEFIAKRLIRLFPMLLICSMATFALVRLLDSEQRFPRFQNSALSFLPSLTFIEPVIWKKFVSQDINSFVDGVYWTLIIEVRFYLVACVVFFLDRKHFFINWIKLATIVIIIRYAIHINNNVYHFSSSLTEIDGLFGRIFFPEYTIYFTIGMLFFMLHEKRKVEIWNILLITIFIVLEGIVFLKGLENVFFASFVALFILFVFKPEWLTPLSASSVQTVGLVSYPLYLLHQNIGLLSIKNLSSLIPDSSGLISLAVVTFGIIAISYLLHTYIDQPIQKHLKNYLFPIKKKVEKPEPMREASITYLKYHNK